MTLYIDSTVRGDSHTRRLADRLVSRIGDGDVRHVCLREERIQPLDNDTLETRTAEAEAHNWESPLFAHALTFAKADQIVIAAPLWDLSFPALLKAYIEIVNVPGIVFRYSDDGRPVGLCRAKRLFYVSTSGGPCESDVFGFGYVEALARNFWGIAEVRRIAATGLDVWGADVEAILNKAEKEIDEISK